MSTIAEFLKTALHGKRIIAAVLACVLFCGLIFYHTRSSSADFVERYRAYQSLSIVSDDAAYIPGIEENAVRQKLNETLVAVLSETTSVRRRNDMAQEGLRLLGESERQINAIGEIGENMAVAIVQMDLAANRASDFTQKGTMREIVALAKKRAEVTQDIRGLSYRANFETAKIFNRIVADEGKLTAAHIAELNRALPTVEEQFNKRTNLYNDLRRVADEIGALFSTL